MGEFGPSTYGSGHQLVRVYEGGKQSNFKQGDVAHCGWSTVATGRT
jgi:hypothetical protein